MPNVISAAIAIDAENEAFLNRSSGKQRAGRARLDTQECRESDDENDQRG